MEYKAGVKGLNIIQAVEAMKQGHKVLRPNWTNWKGSWLEWNDGTEDLCGDKLMDLACHGFVSYIDGQFIIKPRIDIIRPDGIFLIGWNPTQDDIMATDWEIVE